MSMMLDKKNLRCDIINDGLTLYQIKNGLLFGTDALMLSDFICAEHMGAYKNAVEFGTGSGVISLLLAQRNKISRIYAVEIQEIYAELAQYNIEKNNLTDKITIINGDLRNGLDIPLHTMDMIFTNPPYIKYTNDNNGMSGMLSELDHKNIARREIMCRIDDVLKAAACYIKNGGDFYIVYRPDRFQSLFTAMVSHNITPKKIAFVYAGKNSNANLVLVKGKQGAGEGLTVRNIFI